MADIFNPDKEFFVIDSDNVKSVQTQLYGFVVQDNGIIESDSVKNIVHPLSGCGAYVYIDSGRRTIKIHQDFNGSYGLFLFQRDGYFAISNSFFYLLNYIKPRFKLSFDYDYAHFLYAMDLCSESYSDTHVSEIKMLPKNVVVKIDKSKNKIGLDYIDYKTDTIDINSATGIKILDSWYARWTHIFNQIHSRTNNLSITLSGGFDSRLTLMLALGSGVDLNDIHVFSVNDDLHTHIEDYKIASEIAAHYGFELNRDIPSAKSGQFSLCDIFNVCPSDVSAPFGLRDIFNISLYNKLPFHKEMFHTFRKCAHKQYLLTGFGGELVRTYWDNLTTDDRIHQYRKHASRYGMCVSDILSDSVVRVSHTSRQQIADAYGVSDMSSANLLRHVYKETRARNHFGCITVENLFANYYDLSPFLDPMLLRLKNNSDICTDGQLLMAVMFMRYYPELADFRVEGGRFISPETLSCAKRICERFPRRANKWRQSGDVFILTPVDTAVPIDASETDINDNKIAEYLTDVFCAPEFKNLITQHFHCSIYDHALAHSRAARYFPLREMYSVLCSGLVLRTLFGNANDDLYDWFVSLYKTGGASVADLLTRLFTARIDIKLSGAPDAQFRVVTPFDNNTYAKMPAWFQADGFGIVVESTTMHLDLEIVPNIDGQITFYLRGTDMRDDNNRRIPCWIDYTKFDINDTVVFDTLKPVWHDRALVYTFDVTRDTPIRIRIWWQPHIDTRTNI